ncbi:MAG: polymerase sigma factor, sigma-70 family [Clostridia bacterium]|nr:polymerase sigma factor, sigma-70 family [Clostridia bacterium]
MKIDENEIIKYVEPVLRYCLKRLNNRYDAEDLASEIIIHILNGIGKYEIDSLEKWVWRIAHNRYARFTAVRSDKKTIPSGDEIFDISDDYDFIDDIVINEDFAMIFKYLHTLSSEYKNILVDYYIGEFSVKQLADKYCLAETTVKWRLHYGREKIKQRIGDNEMEKVYKRINMNTNVCNGSMNSNKYLYSQIARAICLAAYEKPLTVDEISIKTGLPTMYIEDELPRLIFGDAIVKDGNKYGTNFIILRLCDKNQMQKEFLPLVKTVADHFEGLFSCFFEKVKSFNFYGSDFGMKRLGYIALSSALREMVQEITENNKQFVNGPFPPRQDGGYGWFVVQETEDESESTSPYDSGSNQSFNNPINEKGMINYYWISKYSNTELYRYGTEWLFNNNILFKSLNGVIPADLLNQDDIIRLLKLNLIEKSTDGYKFRFAFFTPSQYDMFADLFINGSNNLKTLLETLILNIWSSFKVFVPKRLDSQINQYVSSCTHSIVGFVTEELIARGVLEKPEDEKPMVNGIFYINGKPNRVI